MVISTPSLTKSSIFKMFPSTQKQKAGVSNRRDYEKLHFCNRLYWTVSLIVEIKLRLRWFLQHSVDATLVIRIYHAPLLKHKARAHPVYCKSKPVLMRTVFTKDLNSPIHARAARKGPGFVAKFMAMQKLGNITRIFHSFKLYSVTWRI